MIGDSILYAYGSAIRKLLNIGVAEHQFFGGSKEGANGNIGFLKLLH
jgi:hypothetical protein